MRTNLPIGRTALIAAVVWGAMSLSCATTDAPDSGRVALFDGETLAGKEFPSGNAFRTERLRFTPGRAGAIRIEFSDAGRGGKFAKAANSAYGRAVPRKPSP